MTDTSRTEHNSAPTSSTLRDRIDRGETGEKVKASDPAASPLGTDAEAGGAPPTGPEVQTAIEIETAKAPERSFRVNRWALGLAGVVLLSITAVTVLLTNLY